MALDLLDAREKLVAVLAPRDNSDPAVLTSLADTISPPALMIGWGDPMLRAERSNCFATGRLLVTAVASRLVPGPGVGVLEELVAYTLGRTWNDAESWELVDVSGPRDYFIAQTHYLAARIIFNVTITQ
jgi:hypothetical protein